MKNFKIPLLGFISNLLTPKPQPIPPVITNNRVTLPLMVDKSRFEIGLNDTRSFIAQHWFCVGKTGSGKTVTQRVIINNYFKNQKKAKIFIVDYKDDYSCSKEGSYFADTINAYEYDLAKKSMPINIFIHIEGFQEHREDNRKKVTRDVSYFVANLLSSLSAKMGGVQKGEIRMLVSHYINSCITDIKIPSMDGFIHHVQEFGEIKLGEYWYEVVEPIGDYAIFTNEPRTIKDLYDSKVNYVFNPKKLSTAHKLLVGLTMVSMLKRYLDVYGERTAHENHIKEIVSLLVIDEASQVVRVSTNDDLKEYVQIARSFGHVVGFGFQALEDAYSNKNIKWGAIIDLMLVGKTDKTPKLKAGEFNLTTSFYTGLVKVIAPKRFL